MPISKIFITSSDKTLLLAEKLKDQVKTDYCKATLCSEKEKSEPSATRVEMLERASREYDFAVIILARDDVIVKEAGGVSARKARDNCVFHAGLFMSALGRHRCFLVNSVERKDLPSDLGGIISIPFEEPDDLGDRQKCNDAIQEVAASIKDKVQQVGAIVDKPLSQEELLERETFTYNGGDLYEGEVVVASVQPLELAENAYKVSQRVRENIDGNIRYIYIFQGDDDGVDKICLLLQLMLLCRFGLSEEHAKDHIKRREMVKGNQKEILEDLEQICNKEGIRIYFLPAPPVLEYCIHNATRRAEAKMYVRRREMFAVWESGPKANQFWKDVRVNQGIRDPQPPHAVIYGAAGFNLKERIFFMKLNTEMSRYFPGIYGKVIDHCLNGPDKI